MAAGRAHAVRDPVREHAEPPPLDEHGNIVIRQKFSRKQLLAYTANLPASLIGLEAKAPSQAIATHRRVYRIEDTQATDVCNAAHRDRIAQILNLALLVGERRSRV